MVFVNFENTCPFHICGIPLYACTEGFCSDLVIYSLVFLVLCKNIKKLFVFFLLLTLYLVGGHIVRNAMGIKTFYDFIFYSYLGDNNN